MTRHGDCRVKIQLHAVRDAFVDREFVARLSIQVFPRFRPDECSDAYPEEEREDPATLCLLLVSRVGLRGKQFVSCARQCTLFDCS